MSVGNSPEATGYLLGGWPALVPLRIGQELTLGRHPEADVVLPFSMISRRHARMKTTDVGEVWIEDFGSLNGSTWCEQRVGRDPVRCVGSGVLSLHRRILVWVSRDDAETFPALPVETLAGIHYLLTWAEHELRDPNEGGLWPAINDPIFADDTMLGEELYPSGPSRSASTAQPPDEMKGELSEHILLPMLLFYLAASTATGPLRLDAPNFSAWILFNEGRMMGARAGRLSGFHALLACAGHERTRFEFKRRVPRSDYAAVETLPTPRLIYETCAHMEGLRNRIRNRA